MSASDDEPRLREVAYRLFATEFDDADFSYSESDEERAPNYVVTPTGARINRLFAVGVLTEIESVNQEVLRARIADPTGAFVVYAGQYQPEALAFLESAEPPLFVAVTGKARTFEPEDSDRVYTSIRPETISEVDAKTRDRWVVQAAEQTVERIGQAASAKQTGVTGDQLRESLETSGLTEAQAAGITLALDHYGTTGDYLQALRETALDAARVVAGERDEARGVSMRPGDGTDDPLPALASLDVEVTAPAASEPAAEPEAAEPAVEPSPSTAPAEESSAETGSTASESVQSVTTDATGSESTETADTSSETASEPETAKPETAETASEPETVEPETVETAQTSATESAPASTPEPESTPATEADSSTATEAEAESPTGTADESSQAATPETTTEQSDAGSESGDDDLGDFEPEFELDEDEREQIESEYGTEFQSGSDVDDPGEADIETPDPEEVATTAETDASAAGAAESAATESADEPSADEPADDSTAASATSADTEPEASEPEPEPDAEAATDVDLEDAVMTAMKELDDGDGADREELVASVVDQHGADPGAVEDAIQDALMGGRCYEPQDGKLTPI